MNNKQYIGRQVSSFEEYEDIGPITGITLVVSEENVFVAGNSTGYMLTVDCPYGSQTMADAILSKLQGYTYRGFRAADAPLAINAELGDGITVNGIYSMLAYRSLEFGPGHMSEIAAPGENELEHEFPYVGSIQREINRKTAATKSLISKTESEIMLEVRDLDDRFTTLSVTVDGVTITDSSGTTYIKGSSIDTSTITANSIAADKLNLTGAITFGDLSNDVANDLNDAYATANSAQSLANSAYSLASSASDDAYYAEQAAKRIANGSYANGTFINQTTITAPEIQGGDIYGANFHGNTFNIYPLAASEGSINTYGYFGSTLYHMLQIAYNAGDGAYVVFSSPGGAIGEWQFTASRFYGTISFEGDVDFSRANVTGLPESSSDSGS